MKKIERCLGCYQKLDGSEAGGYHVSCSKKLFGTSIPPLVNFGIEELDELAKESISRHLGITGVQPKVSLNIEKRDTHPNHRLMIVGLWGDFILKPPTKQFPDMSVVEDLTMHLARTVGIETAKHGLIRLTSGDLAYVTKRFDRLKKKTKVGVEDFCQLSELLTESKYKTSTEKAGKIILRYASNPGLDAVTFFDLNLFSFLTGNSDMHLKNFSLMRNQSNEIVLSPAYDLLATTLLLPEDREEMALTVNGKKAKIKKADFESLGKNLKISDKAIENSFKRIFEAIPQMKLIIDTSFLSNELKKKYEKLISERMEILEVSDRGRS